LTYSIEQVAGGMGEVMDFLVSFPLNPAPQIHLIPVLEGLHCLAVLPYFLLLPLATVTRELQAVRAFQNLFQAVVNRQGHARFRSL
jgi:hypothetical protein